MSEDCVHIDPTTPVPNDGRLNDTEHPPHPFVPEPLDAGDTDDGGHTR